MLIKPINNNCYVKLVWNTTTDAYYNSVRFNFDWIVVCLDKQDDFKINSLGTVELYCATGSSLNSTSPNGYSITVDPITHFTENGFFINTRDLGPGEYSAVQNDAINLPNNQMFASNIQGQFLSPVEIRWSGLDISIGGQAVTDVNAVASENAQVSVYRLVETVFSPTYINEQASINLVRGAGLSVLPVDLSYTVGEDTFDIVNKSNARLSYEWKIPSSIKDYAAQGAAFTEIVFTCKTYDRFGNLIGETKSPGTVLLDSTIAPAEIRDIEISVTDTQYSHLTGDYNVGIKHFSDFWVSFVFVPATGAAVISKKIITESGKVLDMTRASSVKMVDVSDNYIDIVCEDSLGFRVEERRYFPLIDYFKPICSVTSSAISPDGKATLEVTGSYFNQNFGVQPNNLTLRYFIAPASYGDVFGGDNNYITNITYLAGNGFVATVELSGLNYESTYNCQVWAEDRITTYNSNIITVGGKPLFDWGSEDFNFNVPVKVQSGLNVPTDRGIYGENNGALVEALMPLDSTGNTTLGRGNYQAESGRTIIYGNEVDIIAHNGVTINGKTISGYEDNKVLWSGANAMGNGTTITLSEAISNQVSGIVLVFSLYRNGAPENVSLNSFFVSKKEVQLLSGAPHTFLMAINAGFSNLGAKYLYISDNSIGGNETNTGSGNNSGISYDNNSYVLRYVIGV